jgi:hypothetical protein
MPKGCLKLRALMRITAPRSHMVGKTRLNIYPDSISNNFALASMLSFHFEVLTFV